MKDKYKETINGVDYWFDGYQKMFVREIVIPRYKHDFDNLIVVQGNEGSGKSCFAVGLCAQYANLIGAKFTVDNVVFSGQEFLEMATNLKDSVILYDEAIEGLMGANWQNKTQKLIIQALMMARKNNNFYVLCVPSCDKLNSYIMKHRALCMFNVYTRGFERGFVSLYTKSGTQLYYKLYRDGKHKKVNPLYRFTFRDHSKKLIDKAAYEAKKDKSIQGLIRSMSVGKEDKLKTRFYKLLLNCGLQVNDMADCMGVSERTCTSIRREGKKYLEALEGQS